MEPPARPASPMTAVEAVRGRLQRLAATLLVAVLPWLVAPGTLQPDTKTDLVLSPARYLGRALWAWNDHTGIGELQNQAYGYLFPMGPVFLLGDAVGAPGWAVQRVWWTLLLVVGFVGAERVARRLAGLPTVPALLVGGAFALSPRVLTVLSEISVEVWPQAVAPWLLLAAAKGVAPGTTAGDRRRMAVVTGLLAACLGGVNATVSLVALVPAAMWLLLAPAGRRRVRALAWWCLGAAAGAAWWLGPLLVLGRYSYPFLDHVEVASTTTAVASVTNVLRGANHWIAYILTAGEHPTWQSGWVLAQSVDAIIATSVLAGLGLAGLVRRRPEREGAHLTRWALALVLLGVVAMAVGRSGSASGPLAEIVQRWLDGPLAPFRNVHKADLLVRLPVAIGVGLLAHWATRVERGATPFVRQLVVVATVLALVGSLAPVWAGRVGDAWAPTDVPQTWRAAASEVDTMAASDGGTTLVLPGARTADYTWGRVTDEPLGALAASPVLARAAAPLGHPAATRVLDEVDELVATGRRQPQLATGLRRLGISRVVVRGGLDPDVGAVDSQSVAATLAASPGLTRVWSRGDGSEEVSIWRLDVPATPVSVVPQGGVVGVAGAPEAWFALVATGLLDPAAVTTTAGGSADVRTDTLRWQALNSGRPPAAGHSPTLAADNLWPELLGTRDLEPGGQERGRTTRFHDGITRVAVSSSAADPFARQWRSAGDGPASMVDGDPRTAWVSGDGARTQRVTLTLAPGARPTALLVHEAWGGDLAGLAAVEVDGSDGVRVGSTTTWRIPLDGRERRTVTLELTRASEAAAQAPLGIREVQLEDGPRIETGLTVPAGDGPVLITRDPRAGADLAAGEDPQDLVREVGDLPESSISTTVRLRPGDDAQDLVTAPWSLVGSTQPATAEAARDLTRWPVAAVDGDPATRWRPAPGAEPVLDIDLGQEQAVSTITLDRAAGPVTVATDDERYVLPSGTTLTIPQQSTRHLTLTFARPRTQAAWSGPEVTVEGVPGPASRVSLECSEAGAVGRDSGRIGLALTASRSALVSGAAVPATSCGNLPAGSGTVTAAAAGPLVPEMVTLTPQGWQRAAAEPDRTVTSTREHTGRWQVDVGRGGEGLLVLSQGANAGWRATTEDGSILEPVTVDGWRQAFVVPDGGAVGVTVDFVPNGHHRLALGIGALLAGLLVLWGALEVWLRRRAGAVTTAEGEAAVVHATVRDVDADVDTELGDVAADAEAGVAPFVLGVLLGALVGLLVAGWWGLLAGAVGAVLPVRRRATAVALVLGAAGIALAVLGVAERQSAGSLVSQVLGAVTLGVLAAALVRPSSGARDAAPDAPAGTTTGAPDPR
ncbi:alpha-(1-_3)-arabinofuranosyltransferase domain-containing protein [Janibacter sp. G368]|uniref:alpha-(1->3)-arabinofuranosyltransferase domain-containing protein n=1 Tax=Janibacter sp. G368 TaxID=3420441 RepID=UPI003D028620